MATSVEILNSFSDGYGHYWDLFNTPNPQKIHFSHCYGSADAFLIASLFSKSNKILVCLTADAKQAERLSQECSLLINSESVALFPSRDSIPYNIKSPFGPTTESRFKVLDDLLNVNKKIIIAPAISLLQKLPCPKTLFNKTIRLRVNDSIDPQKLSSWLQEIGFTHETSVETIGSFTIRGGIVDIYPFLTTNPIRIELWGDTIETIREYDIFSQKSVNSISEVTINPMREFIITDTMVNDALELIYSMREKLELKDSEYEKIVHAWKYSGDHEGIEWFLHWFNLPYANLFDYLPNEAIFIWNDIHPFQQRFDECIDNYKKHLNRVPDIYKKCVSKPNELLIDQDKIISKIETYPLITINTESTTTPEEKIDISTSLQPSFNSSIEMFVRHCKKREEEGYALYLICESNGHVDRMKELLHADIPTLAIINGYIRHGFEHRELKLSLFSEGHLFNRNTRFIPTRKAKSSRPISSFDALDAGDFVVHIDHGIAKFRGIERVRTHNSFQDCMVLIFHNDSKVYVPVDDFVKVQKYIGKNAEAPTLSNIGSKRWENIKEKTKDSLKKMAQELIGLYAKRDILEGICFSQDSVWQKEFDDSFLYEPTVDQLSAIKSVKDDMESAKPMDRLVCGDVGFGKTEIAMRAAFKAAIDGYQVAILAPTTILAAQHFSTFKERMAEFPVNVALLSRFQKPREQKLIIDKIKTGSTNIIIGTHRILSKDVGFTNLGLLIIDEEQRFGVKHKEKLKEFRYKVDVLSMTATPIPRTLHMSLVGIRDLSIINTPPRNRLPVETTVTEYDEEIIRLAIEQELERGGQTYIVHNRIKNLYILQNTIEELVPQARIAVAHGQLNEKELETIMNSFIAGNYDILLATTIIENGLDISNVNTIIINRADAMGLSQLYQLRGRVGRSSEQAFAWFLTPPFKQLSDISLKRLRALEQYTELGSGFQIAMRDLEIRGAGNLLGTHQHGYIAAVGFELYCQLLKEEVDKLLNEETQQKDLSIKIDMPLDTFIPTEYISENNVRISIYQECSSCKTSKNINTIRKDLMDRFGPIPEEVDSLLLLMEIRILCRQLSISHLAIGNEKMCSVSFHGDEHRASESIKAFLQNQGLYDFSVIYGEPIVLKGFLTGQNSKLQAIEIKKLLISMG